MKYDFTSIIERSGKDAVAVDGPGHDAYAPALPKNGYDFIPMWVADMNFPLCPQFHKPSLPAHNILHTVILTSAMLIIIPLYAGRKHEMA